MYSLPQLRGVARYGKYNLDLVILARAFNISNSSMSSTYTCRDFSTESVTSCSALGSHLEYGIVVDVAALHV